jgi:hypothetical protein
MQRTEGGEILKADSREMALCKPVRYPGQHHLTGAGSVGFKTPNPKLKEGQELR